MPRTNENASGGMDINFEPWARVNPADDEQAMIEAGKDLSKSERDKLNSLETEYGELFKRWQNECSEKHSRDEIEKVRKSNLAASEKVEKIREIELHISSIPELQLAISNRFCEIARLMLPAAEKVLRLVKVKVESAIDELSGPSTVARSIQWGVSVPQGNDWLLHPLQRLESIVACKLKLLEHQDGENLWVVRHTLARAAVIKPIAPAPSMI